MMMTNIYYSFSDTNGARLQPDHYHKSDNLCGH